MCGLCRMGESPTARSSGLCSRRGVVAARRNMRFSPSWPENRELTYTSHSACNEMNERNTPGVVRVLSAYRLEYIPEAHYNGGRIDGTELPAAAEPIDHFLQEEAITVDQIGAYR